jgi:preprotein translocase subunit SecY
MWALKESKGWAVFFMVVAIGLVIIATVIFMEQGQRRIPVQYARRMVGRKMYGGSSTYIPLKVNQAGVIPVIFASSLLYLPALLTQFDQDASSPITAWIAPTSSVVTTRCTCALLRTHRFFTYFYVAITFNPAEIADNMKKYGGFIPGIRAGKPTEEYLNYVLSRITLPERSTWASSR